MSELGPNADLIGRAGSREHLATPALVLDVDRLEANIESMARYAETHGFALRPTVKIHKCAEIARRQIGAGATIGVCCATLAEAEAMVDAGIPGVMLFQPVTTPEKVARVAALNARADDFLVAVDSAANARALSDAARQQDRDLQLLVDVEVGGGRTGIAHEDEAVALVHLIREMSGASYAGVQAYVGSNQTIVDYDERSRVTRDHYAPLAHLVARLRDEGLEPPIVSGGGTGTHAIEADIDLITEVQVGTYVFMDLNYMDVVMRPDDPHPFRPALFVRTTVISSAQRGFAVTDAGVKEVDGFLGPRMPALGRGPEDASYSLVGDDMGRVDFASPHDQLQEGEALELIPPHCWLTAAMYPVYHCVRGDALVDIWPLVGWVNH
jgi:3-hydroxy-D-aspartate aldolase